jgi:hypothetical protein
VHETLNFVSKPGQGGNLTFLYSNVRRVAVASIAVLGAAVLLDAPPATASGDPVASSEVRPPAVVAYTEHYAQKIRGEMGLRNDLAYVRGLRTRSDVSSSTLGTPLTAAEDENVKARRILSEWSTVVTGAGARESDFGGAWIDQKAGGVLRVGVAGETGTAVYDRVTAALPRDQRVVPARVTHTLRELDATQRGVIDVLQRSTLRGHVVESAVMLPDNAVVLTVDAGAPMDGIPALKHRYPALKIRVVSGGGYVPQSSRNFTSGPLYGGEWVSSALSTAGGCTVGYSFLINSLNQNYAVTAGHCKGSMTWYQGKYAAGPAIGSAHSNHFSTGGKGNCDCVALGPLPTGKPSTSVLIGGNSLFHYTHTASKAEQGVGTTTCVSGAASYDTNGGNIVCGNVVANNVVVPYSDDSFTLTDATTTTCDTLANDSGAPYGNGTAFFGIHSAYSTGLGQSAFTKAYNVAAAFNGSFHY